MSHRISVETLQRLVLTHELPRRERARFGVTCPYCGKSDRILVLDGPDELEEEAIHGEDRTAYREAWADLADRGTLLGVCRFCTNILELPEGKQRAVPFEF